MDIDLRPATKADVPQLAALSIMAGGGTFELLLQGLKRNVTVQQAMEVLCAAEDTEYSWRYYSVVEVDGQVAGAVNFLSVADRYKLAPNINPLLQKELGFGYVQLIKFLFRARHLKGMQVLKAPPNSLHINEIGIYPEFQGQGLGKQLVALVINEAKAGSFDYVSLNVWADNTLAIKFYERLGFKLVRKSPVKRHTLLPHDEGVLMVMEV